MLGRRRRRGGGPDPAATARMRAIALGLDPAEFGLAPTQRHPRVFGAMLEHGLDDGGFTLVSLADGTTSLYLSSGGGVIGGGEHEPIVEATLAFLDATERHLGSYRADVPAEPPPEGLAVLHALTYSGRRSAGGTESDLAERRHPLSPVFFAAHDVITLVRELVDG